jgi:hypothetical protein
VRRWTIAFAAAFVGLTGCGGGGTTTVINKTVTASGAEANRANSTYLPSPAYERKYVEPTDYSFSVDGALVAKDLRWEGWGSPIATGIGTIEERNWASGEFNDRPTYRGSVVASGLERCKGRAYYTEVVAQVPSNAVYVPKEATQLTTPCRTFESIQDERSPTPSPPSEGPPLTFQTPSGNIGCSVGRDEVFCSIAEITWSPPPVPDDCEPPASETWGHSISLRRDGATFLCTDQGMIGDDTGLLTLDYGKAIRKGPFACESREQALVCIVPMSKHGIVLSLQKVRLF